MCVNQLPSSLVSAMVRNWSKWYLVLTQKHSKLAFIKEHTFYKKVPTEPFIMYVWYSMIHRSYLIDYAFIYGWILKAVCCSRFIYIVLSSRSRQSAVIRANPNQWIISLNNWFIWLGVQAQFLSSLIDSDRNRVYDKLIHDLGSENETHIFCYSWAALYSHKRTSINVK